MPWTTNDYPDSLQNLNENVREKAIEIANALVDDGYGEGRAISIATAQAKDWAQRRNIEVWAEDPKAPNQHVVPHEGKWAVRAAGSEKATKLLPTKEDALDEARSIALNHGSDIVLHNAEGAIDDVITPQG